MGTCTVECWGCRKSETHPILHGEEYDKLMADMAARGWRRRAFWSPNWDKGPWFCSEDCAQNSHNAKAAQQYWEERGQKEFEEYCRKTSAKRAFLTLGIMIAAFISTILLGEYLYARL